MTAKFSVNELTTFRWTFEEDVERYTAAGIHAMGVWRQKLSDYGEEKGAELLAERGIKVSNLLWAGGFTGSDGRSFNESVTDAMEALRLAALLKCRSLVVYSGPKAGHTHSHARRLLSEALTRLAPLAEEFGVDLAIEPMHLCCANEWTFLTDLYETLDFLAGFDCAHFKLAVDTYYVGRDERFLQQIDKIAQHVSIVHLADSQGPPCSEPDRCPLGTGTIPLRQIISNLLDAGYDGYFDVELIGPEIEATDYQQLLDHTKKAFRELSPPL